jgi:Kdo2-lipid IVA lauroyltransferase/acyltransferase
VSEPAPRRHRRPHSPTRASLEYRLARALLGTLHALPLGAATATAASVVGVVPLVAARLRRIGLDNLAHAFPERDAGWRGRVLRESFRNLGRLGAEVAHFDELDAKRLHEIVGFVDSESERSWGEARDRRSGIVATGHFGNWELFAHAQALLARPIHLVHRPLRNPRVDDLVSAIRGRAGTGVIYKHAAARDILRKLREDALIAIPIDQHAPGAEGVPIPFFGRPAATTLGPARLAQIARVPVYMAVLVREGTTNRHRICMRPSHPPPPPGKDPAALVDLTTRLVREFEEVVRAHPEQWLWMHRRWRLGGSSAGS